MNDSFKLRTTKKRSLASVDLEIGAEVKISVKLYVLYRMEKKQSAGYLEKSTNEPLTTMTQVCHFLVLWATIVPFVRLYLDLNLICNVLVLIVFMQELRQSFGVLSD